MHICVRVCVNSEKVPGYVYFVCVCVCVCMCVHTHVFFCV